MAGQPCAGRLFQSVKFNARLGDLFDIVGISGQTNDRVAVAMRRHAVNAFSQQGLKPPTFETVNNVDNQRDRNAD